MSSLSGILNTARSAIFAHQNAIQVTSHNIANAQTPGYTRQKAQLTASYPQLFPYGSMGTGVTVDGIARMRDQLADASVRRELGHSAGYGVQHDVLSSIETIFGEPSDTGLAATLDAFWGAWSDLASEPASGTARVMVRQRGQQLVSLLNQSAQQLVEVKDSLRMRMTAQVADINGIARQLAAINTEIVSAESAGQSANDLRDTRDRLIDQMSGIGQTRVLERADGSAQVIVDGISLVDGSSAKELTVELNEEGRASIQAGGQIINANPAGSQLASMVQLYNDTVPGVEAQLDSLARGLVESVNALHNPSDPPEGSDFFNREHTSAGRISLSEEILSNHWNVTASSEPGLGNNDIAQKLAALRNAPVMGETNGISLNEYFRELVTGVALQVRSAETSRTVHQTLADQAEIRRQSVSGVNTDEELVLLMQHQQAYTAATRLVNVVDEMMQSILQMV